MQRRDFVRYVATTGAALLPACQRNRRRSAAGQGRLIMLALDGVDPAIVDRLMRQGRLPNYRRLAESGTFTRLATSTPPHTPVAFSNIISGADPGVHNVFDFIHRDPSPPDSVMALRPYFSTAEVVAPESQRALSIGQWQLPLLGGATQLLRRGPAFWDYLVAHGVDTDVYYFPANYPVDSPTGPGRFRCVSGMGTPDLLGGYGEFTLFTPDAPRRGRRVGGGRFVYLSMIGHRGQAILDGPPNHLRRPTAASGEVEPLRVTLDIVRDAENRVAKIEVCGQLILLNEGEWSDWIPIQFPTGIPGSAVLTAAGAPTIVPGMVRLFLKHVYPKFELYVSPINIDPIEPIGPICSPDDYAAELAKRHGRFHTLGIPEDTKALSHGALSEDQFLAQARASMNERAEQYRAALANFQQGCLGFYVGATDLLQHMFWRDQDPQHPGRDPEQAERYAGVVEELYIETDPFVGQAIDALGSGDTLMVFSDHGFNSFRRGFNLNSWLIRAGLMRRVRPTTDEMFADTDWSQTKAYGLGMNGLYVNLSGREKFGSVRASEKKSLLSEIRDKLMEVKDVDGTNILQRIDRVEDLYPQADPTVAPDLILGYQAGYRASWSTVLGGAPQDLIEDNLDRWSGTHLISADLVPGMLLANRKIDVAQPSISDIAPTVLAAFGINVPSHMTGKNLFALKR